MLKRVTAVLFCFLFLFCLITPVSAKTTAAINDEAGLLLSDEIRSLEEIAAQLKDLYDIQAAVLTVNSLNGFHAQEFADNYYDNAGYIDDGVIFLLAMAEREWYISTSGTIIYALTDYGIQKIGEGAVSYFAEELWYDGFAYFLGSLPAFLDALENGSPIDGYADYSGDYYHGDQDEVLYYEEEFSPSFAVALLCGIAVSGIVVLIMRLCMSTNRPQRCASVYIKEGSWKLTQHRDVFLYSNVTKVRKQEPPQNNGGGSSTHRSSSGSRHGGGGGKF